VTAHAFPFSIAYADTDAGGIVYHARYIEIAERARMNWMRGHVPPDGDIGFVIRELSVKYKRPLRLGDEFVVETRAVDIGAASIKVEQKFVKNNEIYAMLTGTAAYIGADMKPKRIPETWNKYLKQTKEQP
jgi:acyl-CoA thioester hydrolase